MKQLLNFHWSLTSTKQACIFKCFSIFSPILSFHKHFFKTLSQISLETHQRSFPITGHWGKKICIPDWLVSGFLEAAASCKLKLFTKKLLKIALAASRLLQASLIWMKDADLPANISRVLVKLKKKIQCKPWRENVPLPLGSWALTLAFKPIWLRPYQRMVWYDKHTGQTLFPVHVY